jgi:hypothetical protein
MLPEDLAQQFFGEQLKKTFDWKRAQGSFKLEGAFAP